MNADEPIAGHYSHGTLEQAILEALQAMGKDPARIAADDLAPVDEFHTGGRPATVELLAPLGLTADMHLLDVGSGLGGPARYVAGAFGCRVTGIDLTEEYVRVAGALSRRVGLGDRVEFRHGSAVALPFAEASFDGAYMIHVGMNIADKPALFAAVRRVLRPGARFALFDMMRRAAGDLAFPVPWAAGPATSFVATPAAYRSGLEQAGFAIGHERERRDFAIDFFRKVRARMAEAGLPPLSLQIVMGADFGHKIANLLANLERGLLAPVEMVARAP